MPLPPGAHRSRAGRTRRPRHARPPGGPPGVSRGGGPLPASHKMMDPRYQEVKTGQIPEVEAAKGVRVRVIAGQVRDVHGPVRDIVVEPEYLDVRIAPRTAFDHPVKKGH